MQKPSRRRTFWAFVAFNLAVAGLVVESVMHLCHDFVFDPFRDPLLSAAFIGTTAMLLVNEWALASPRWDYQVVAFIGTSAAFPVALLTAILFLPLLPVSIPLLAVCGLGILAWMPALAVGVFSAQLLTLWRQIRQDETPWPVLATALAVCAVSGAYLTVLWHVGAFHPHAGL